MKMTILDRILLLLTGLMAGYQIAVGIEGLNAFPVTAYSIAFGVLLIAGLLLIILGFEILDSPIVVIISTIIPLCLATGLVWQHLTNYKIAYLVFAIAGLLAIIVTRMIPFKNKLPLIVLATAHGIAGLTIFLLPIFLIINHSTQPGYILVSVGGALIGIGGMLLGFLKAGKPLISRETIFRVLPGLLLLMTAAFVAGFTLGQ